MSAPRGVRLSLDWGKARIGVAACDPAAVLAFPLTTVTAGPGELAVLADLVAEHEPIEVIVGLPRRLAGDEGPAAAYVRERAAALGDVLAERKLDVPLRLVDERLSTVTAAQRLRQAGRPSRRQREVIDAAAAVAILETALAEGARSVPEPLRSTPDQSVPVQSVFDQSVSDRSVSGSTPQSLTSPRRDSDDQEDPTA